MSKWVNTEDLDDSKKLELVNQFTDDLFTKEVKKLKLRRRNFTEFTRKF